MSSTRKVDRACNRSELQLKDLRNIGKAMLKDFELLGIQSVRQLAQCNADELYERMQTLTSSRHDPCVWDTYAAAIHQARTGQAFPWWEFTKVRKERENLPSAREKVKTGNSKHAVRPITHRDQGQDR